MSNESQLSILVPIPITDSNLTSSTVAEPSSGENLWVATTSYTVGTRVIRPTTHRIYENAIAGIDAGLPENTPARWTDVAPSNKYAMFDNEINTQTVVTSNLTTVTRPGFFNALYLAGLEATGVEITVKDNPTGTVVYHYVGTLEGSQPDDYYEHFFDPFKPLRDLQLGNIPPYLQSELTVKLTSSGTVKCGLIAIGDLKPLGTSQYGAKAKPKTYSYIDTDKQGTTYIVKKKNAKDMTISAVMPLGEANRVLETVTDLLGTSLFISATSLTEYAGLRGFGLIDGELSYDNQSEVTLNLKVSGMI